MSERQQFTFYRSFWEAAKVLPPKDKTAVLEAICAYALDEEERELSVVANAIFALIKPNLDASKRKAESGKKGGANSKQNASKAEANSKQNGSKTEANDKQIESEKEKENECYISSTQVSKVTPTFAEDSKPYQCAVFLDASIRDRLPTKPAASPETLQSWAYAFDKLNRLDGQDWDTIAAVLEWSQADSFWCKNIMSGDKFRKQFFRLLAEAQGE